MAAGSLIKFTKPVLALSKNGIRFISKNSNVILTVIGASGVVASVAVAIKGTIKAVKLCEEKQVTNGKEVLKTVWKCYIPTIGLVILTTTAILCNGKINAKKIAVLTSAYSGSVEALRKVEEKMSEQIGPKKTRAAVDEAEGALAANHAPSTQNDIIATGKGKQLFFCATTGQWFYSDWNGVELAEAKIQNQLSEMIRKWGSSGDYIQVCDAQEALGLPETDMGQYMGWNVDDFICSDIHSKSENATIHFVVSSEWEELPWGRELVGVVRMEPWPENI